MQDPFATTSTTDEAQSAPEPTYDIDAPTGTPIKVNPLIVPASEGKITVTLKGGLGFDAPWIVIHAADAAEASSQLGSEMVELMNRVQGAGKYFAGLYSPNTSTTPSASAAQPVSAPPAGATAPPSGETRSCKHGAMTYKSGVAKASGKPWQAFMCPTPKGAPDQCEAQWIR